MSVWNDGLLTQQGLDVIEYTYHLRCYFCRHICRFWLLCRHLRTHNLRPLVWSPWYSVSCLCIETRWFGKCVITLGSREIECHWVYLPFLSTHLPFLTSLSSPTHAQSPSTGVKPLVQRLGLGSGLGLEAVYEEEMIWFGKRIITWSLRVEHHWRHLLMGASSSRFFLSSLSFSSLTASSLPLSSVCQKCGNRTTSSNGVS